MLLKYLFLVFLLPVFFKFEFEKSFLHNSKNRSDEHVYELIHTSQQKKFEWL